MAKSKKNLLEEVVLRIDKSVDKVKGDVSQLNATMGVLRESQSQILGNLDEHMRRTALAENSIEVLKASHEEMHKELVPLKEHVALWSTAGKILALLATLATIVGAVYEIFIR
jgi:hypothetical protein